MSTLTRWCRWGCGATARDQHGPGCPGSPTAIPLAGTGWLLGLGHCSMAYGDNRKQRCAWCGTRLGPRRRRWCSQDCSFAWADNHFWTEARATALRNGGSRCRRCGRGPGNYALLRGVLAAFGVPVSYADVPQHTQESWSWFCSAALEVNHITPIRGRHGEAGCHHHQSGLEVLCVPDHRRETNRQRRAGWTSTVVTVPDAEALILALA